MTIGRRPADFAGRQERRTTSRRDVLKAGFAGAGFAGAGLIGGVAAAAERRFFTGHALPIGVQLYTLDPDLDADFDGTLRALARIGYRAVELAGFHGRSAAALRAAFDRAGLACRSGHFQPSGRGNGPSFDDVDALARDAHVIGLTDVVLPIPLFPHDFRPPAETNAGDGFRASGKAMQPDDWRRTAAFLNEKGRALRAQGLRMGYHNHNFEFAPHGGVTGMEVLLGETDPALVSFEMDAGWVEAAGQDPLALLARHPGRFTQIHVKDIKRSTVPNFEFRQDPIEVGGGRIDWRRILPAAYAAGVRRFFVEQEPPFPGPRIASVAKSFRYLNDLRTA